MLKQNKIILNVNTVSQYLTKLLLFWIQQNYFCIE